MKLRLLLPIALVLICPFLFAGCSGQSKDYLYDDETKIAGEGDSYFQYKANSNTVGPDYNCNMELFSGMETIWRFDASSDTTLIGTCDFMVLKGDVKLVLITPDNEVATILEQTENSPKQGLSDILLTVKKGSNRLKLVAKNKAELNMTLDLSEGRAE